MENLINENLVLFDVEADSRDDVINKMADAFDGQAKLADKDQYIKDVLAREATCSTAIGFRMATPHAKSGGVKEPALGFMRLKKAIKWDEDSEEIDTVFMIGVPEGEGDKHLEILAAIFRQLVHKEFRNELKKASSPDDVIALIQKL